MAKKEMPSSGRDYVCPYCFTKVDKLAKNKVKPQIAKLCRQMGQAGDTTVIAVSKR